MTTKGQEVLEWEVLEEGGEAQEGAVSQEDEVARLAVHPQAQDGGEDRPPQSFPRYPHHDHTRPD